MPHGVLFRGGAEGKIRQRASSRPTCSRRSSAWPPTCSSGASIPVAICVLNRDEARRPRRGKVLFVDAAQPGYYRSEQGP